MGSSHRSSPKTLKERLEEIHGRENGGATRGSGDSTMEGREKKKADWVAV